jgi:hypothetical protein
MDDEHFKMALIAYVYLDMLATQKGLILVRHQHEQPSNGVVKRGIKDSN